jgi:hypothetical protein
MIYSQCEKCKYCQKRYNKDKYGNFINGYYGCNYPPHWGKHIETIGVCPSSEKEKKI